MRPLPARPFTELHSATTHRLIEPIPAIIQRFPTTRYYGSKRKLIAWMHSHLSSLHFTTVLDAFGGTASVSLLFKIMNKSVTYNDAFLFNEDVARTILAEKPALDRTRIKTLLNDVQPHEGTISKNFPGVFFRDDENAWLDGFATSQRRWGNEQDQAALMRYLVYQACLKKRPFNLFHRANLALRTKSDVKRSFGNATTWERTFIHHAFQAYDELPRTPSTSPEKAVVLKSGDASALRPGYDLVYIDPPYVGHEDKYNRDDYWRRYHFLEGLARYEDWPSRIDHTSDVRLFEAPPWFAEWGRRGTFRDRLYAFIDTHRHSLVVLSYVSGAIPDESEIRSYFEERFARVHVHSATHSHALSKTQKRELLFIGIPR